MEGSSTGGDACSVLIGIIIILTGLLIVSDAFIVLYFRRMGRFKTWLKAIKNFINNTAASLTGFVEGLMASAFGYSYDTKQTIFYSKTNCWQRKYGYCRLYDATAALSGMIIDCEPVYFEYDNRKWLIEFWKGQYLFMTGCEIGVYNTSRPEIDIPELFSGTFFDCAGDEDMINMSFKLFKNDTLLFQRDAVHWWLNGFKAGEFSNPQELKMEIKITLKDAQMLGAFTEGLKQAGYNGSETVINGLTVSIVFDKPHNPQPHSRTVEIEKMAQWNNRSLCDLFNSLTGKIKSVPRKILRVRMKNKNILRDMGKSREIFDIYGRIEPYLHK
jgi:hypothetical protein